MSTSPSEEGDGLRRADSLPALRVVGFDLLRGSESAHEMHLLSQSGIASPAVSSPLSRLLGATTGKRERESPDGGGFFSAESSDSDAREAVAPLEKATSMDTIGSNVSNEAETIIFRHDGSFAAATPIDIPYRAGNQRHWRRCAFFSLSAPPDRESVSFPRAPPATRARRANRARVPTRVPTRVPRATRTRASPRLNSPARVASATRERANPGERHGGAFGADWRHNDPELRLTTTPAPSPDTASTDR